MYSAVIDSNNRRFRKLRISLLNQCNFSCNYCVAPSNSIENNDSLKLVNGDVLSADNIFSIVKAIHKVNPLDEIKLTGGEPLLYHNFTKLVGLLNKLKIEKTSITTNGQFLKPLAKELSHLGIKNINVSLDAVESELFYEITKKDAFEKVIDGILTAKSFGIQVKLNAVIMRGINDNQINLLIDFAKENGLTVRFLELMKMGYLYRDNKGLFFSENDILKKIAEKHHIKKEERKEHATANYWEMEDGFKFGIIANESSPFCKDCDRLRLDSSGKIYGCICSVNGIDIKPVLDNESELIEKLRKALYQKQPVKFSGSPISMKQIGG